jgi:hypothetical protein
VEIIQEMESSGDVQVGPAFIIQSEVTIPAGPFTREAAEQRDYSTSFLPPLYEGFDFASGPPTTTTAERAAIMAGSAYRRSGEAKPAIREPSESESTGSSRPGEFEYWKLPPDPYLDRPVRRLSEQTIDHLYEHPEDIPEVKEFVIEEWNRYRHVEERRKVFTPFFRDLVNADAADALLAGNVSEALLLFGLRISGVGALLSGFPVFAGLNAGEFINNNVVPVFSNDPRERDEAFARLEAHAAVSALQWGAMRGLLGGGSSLNTSGVQPGGAFSRFASRLFSAPGTRRLTQATADIPPTPKLSGVSDAVRPYTTEAHRTAVREAVDARRTQSGNFFRETTSRQDFREWAIDEILAEPDHPLLPLLDEHTGDFLAPTNRRWETLRDWDTPEMGHLVARMIEPENERFALQWGYSNQVQRIAEVRGRSSGYIIEREAFGIANGAGRHRIVAHEVVSTAGHHGGWRPVDWSTRPGGSPGRWAWIRITPP